MAISFGDGVPTPGLGGDNIAAGYVDGWSDIHKFGAADVGTSFIPVCRGGVWQTPQVGSQTQLRVKAGGNANDTAAGSGARKIMLEGIDETGALITDELTLAGTSASSASSEEFLRLTRAWVTESGSYANATTPSHSDDIVIENSAGTADWATIDSTGFARGQSEIACYTVPLGYRAFIQGFVVNSDSSKSTDFLFYQRRNILETSAPYTSMRLIFEAAGLAGEEIVQPLTPYGPFPALTDLGFMAKVSSGSGEVEADFEIILQKWPE